MKTVLIADADYVFAKQLSRALEESGNFQVIDIALNGKLTVRMVEERHPDVLVMDILLPELDGLSVLEAIGSVVPPPIVIAASAFLSNYVAVAAMDLGVRQLIKKPCSAEFVAASVARAYRIPPRSGIEYDRRSLIANTLHDVGVPANIKGYSYLIDALELTIANPNAAFSMTQSYMFRLPSNMMLSRSRYPGQSSGQSISPGIGEIWIHYSRISDTPCPIHGGCPPTGNSYLSSEKHCAFNWMRNLQNNKYTFTRWGIYATSGVVI